MKSKESGLVDLTTDELMNVAGGRIAVVSAKTGKEAPRYQVTGTDGKSFYTYMPPKRVKPTR